MSIHGYFSSDEAEETFEQVRTALILNGLVIFSENETSY